MKKENAKNNPTAGSPVIETLLAGFEYFANLYSSQSFDGVEITAKTPGRDRAYRRAMTAKKQSGHIQAYTYGKTGERRHDNTLTGRDCSDTQQFYKRISAKKVRRNDELLPMKGNGYRKVFDYEYSVT